MNNANHIRNMNERTIRSVVVEWLKKRKSDIIQKTKLKSMGRCIT